jgi:hypothetical protein
MQSESIEKIGSLHSRANAVYSTKTAGANVVATRRPPLVGLSIGARLRCAANPFSYR